MIGGSRDYAGYKKIMNYLKNNVKKDNVISNSRFTNSPDILASEWAKDNRVMVDMADMADICVFFWDKKSSGTVKTTQYAVQK
jgi:hypothetical protein